MYPLEVSGYSNTPPINVNNPKKALVLCHLYAFVSDSIVYMSLVAILFFTFHAHDDNMHPIRRKNNLS